MAGNSVIGALRVVLGADTGSFDDGLKRAQGSLDAFAAGFKKAIAGLTIAAVAGAFIGSIKGMIDEADKLGKSAQKWGVPVEELSKLSLAAKLSDVSFESLGTSMGKLSKAMASVASGADSDMSRAFKAIGVAVNDTNGKLRPTVDVLGDIAEKFKGYEDNAAKTALAIQIFGKAGANMIPLLNAGRDGLKEASKEAEQFGIVVDTKTAKAAEAFNDNLTRLGAAKDGIILRVTAGLLPAMEKLSAAFVQNAKDANLTDNTSKALSVTLQVLATGAQVLATGFNQAIIAVGGFFTGLKQLGTLDFSGFTETMRKMSTDSTASLVNAASVINTIWNGAVKDAVKVAEESGPKISAPIVQAAASARGALESYLAAQQKQQAALQAEVATFGLAAGAKERLRVVLEALAIAQANNITLTDGMRQKISETAFATEQLKLKLAGLKLAEEVLPPYEQFNQVLQRNKELFDAGVISVETFQRANRRAAETANATWAQAGESIAGSIAKIGQTFAKESKAMAMVAKIAGIIQSTISMFTGAAKALELPFPANLAAMASVLATGAGIVAQIKATSVSGFASGGQFRVPGGMGGGDTVHAAFQPGEIVDVWRPGETDRVNDPRRGAGGGSVPTFNLNVTWEPGREFLRGLIDQLGDMARDGYRLQIADA